MIDAGSDDHTSETCFFASSSAVFQLLCASSKHSDQVLTAQYGCVEGSVLVSGEIQLAHLYAAREW